MTHMLRKKPKIPPPAEVLGYWREVAYGPKAGKGEGSVNDEDEE